MTNAFVLSCDVALRTLDVAMLSFQGVLRCGVIECTRRPLERHSHRMATRTIGAEAAVMRIPVTRDAGGADREIRTGLVTLIALQRRVKPFNRKAGFSSMIELRRIERPQLCIATGVLDMAGDTVVRDIAVDALLLCDPLGNGLMTGQAARSRNALSLLMTLHAVRATFEIRMRLRQRSGRQQSTQLARRGHGQGNGQNESDQRSLHGTTL
jgi:hypothetical protein